MQANRDTPDRVSDSLMNLVPSANHGVRGGGCVSDLPMRTCHK
jgi:hypothetical protein